MEESSFYTEAPTCSIFAYGTDGLRDDRWNITTSRISVAVGRNLGIALAAPQRIDMVHLL